MAESNHMSLTSPPRVCTCVWLDWTTHILNSIKFWLINLFVTRHHGSSTRLPGAIRHFVYYWWRAKEVCKTHHPRRSTSSRIETGEHHLCRSILFCSILFLDGGTIFCYMYMYWNEAWRVNNSIRLLHFAIFCSFILNTCSMCTTTIVSSWTG